MPNHTLFTPEQDQRIRQENESGEYLWAISKRYNTGSDAIKNAIRRAGGDPIKHKQVGAKPRISKSVEKQIVSMYQSDDAVVKIMSELDLGRKTVENALKRNGVALRRMRPNRKVFSDDQKQLMIKLYSDGQNTTKVARALGTSTHKVSEVLHSAGVELTSSREGRANKTWSPSRIVGPGGYVKIKLRPEDPRFAMTIDRGYVLEHRYNMACKLNRGLEHDETVHHIDGDRSNNNIKNLQLRTGNHGKGVVLECQSCGSHNIGSVPIA